MNFLRKDIALIPLLFIKTWKWVLELIFPAFCLGCEREGSFLCEPCLKKIPRQQKQTCPLCYIANSFGEVCLKCKREDFYLDSLFAVSKFEEKSLLRKCIHSLKYDFIEELAQPLGKMLFDAFRVSLRDNKNMRDSAIILCPISLHKKRLKWRGFNQAALLTEKMLALNSDGIFHNIKIRNPLERITFNKPQMELSQEERLKNMRNAFMVKNKNDIRESDKNTIFLLVDDIATTLATLNSAAQVLKQAGAKYVSGLVLARVY